MRVLLISANTESTQIIPLPLGLNCVAVATRNAGHEVEVLDLMDTADRRQAIGDALGRINPGAIGISVRNVDDQKMTAPRFLLEPVRELIAWCRSDTDTPIIVGGAGFSIFPEAALHYLGADIGVCGEGEIAFPLLLEALEQGGDLSAIAGLCLPGQPVQQGCAARAALNRLPLPDPQLWQVPEKARRDFWVPFQTCRGCGLRCSYCSTPALEGIRIRRQPLPAVLETIARHRANGYEQFYFVDNTFNLPPDYAKSLCRGLLRDGLQLRWRGILYPAFLDRELAQLMAESDCLEVSLGFESGNEMVLRRLNKKFLPRQVRETADLLAEYGIRRMGFLLLGGPGETRASVLESLAFADSLQLEQLKLTLGIRIYPGTELHRIAREEGVVAPDDDLLSPRFYLAPGLEKWLSETIAEWMTGRPCCCT